MPNPEEIRTAWVLNAALMFRYPKGTPGPFFGAGKMDLGGRMVAGFWWRDNSCGTICFAAQRAGSFFVAEKMDFGGLIDGSGGKGYPQETRTLFWRLRDFGGFVVAAEKHVLTNTRSFLGGLEKGIALGCFRKLSFGTMTQPSFWNFEPPDGSMTLYALCMKLDTYRLLDAKRTHVKSRDLSGTYSSRT